MTTTTFHPPFMLEGEPLSLDDLCAMEYGRIHLRIYTFTGSIEQADDLTQVVFLKVTATVRRSTKPILFEHLGHLRAWLNMIAKYVIIDYARHVKLYPALSLQQLGEQHGTHHDQDFPFEVADPASMEDQVAARVDLALFLPKLSTKDRNVLLSFYALGNTYKQVCQEFGCTPKQFSTIIHRCKEHFRRHYLGIPIQARPKRRRA